MTSSMESWTWLRCMHPNTYTPWPWEERGEETTKRIPQV